MTDTEIIKALECLGGDSIFCQSRAYDPSEFPRCKENCAKDAIDLINRQKAEIESMQAQIDELWETGKRLKAEKDNLIRTYKECALEVVKEFAERLKWQGIIGTDVVIPEMVVFFDDIDYLVKEMVGEA